jgi:hypothetical protein
VKAGAHGMGANGSRCWPPALVDGASIERDAPGQTPADSQNINISRPSPSLEAAPPPRSCLTPAPYNPSKYKRPARRPNGRRRRGERCGPPTPAAGARARGCGGSFGGGSGGGGGSSGNHARNRRSRRRPQRRRRRGSRSQPRARHLPRAPRGRPPTFAAGAARGRRGARALGAEAGARPSCAARRLWTRARERPTRRPYRP